MKSGLDATPLFLQVDMLKTSANNNLHEDRKEENIHTSDRLEKEMNEILKVIHDRLIIQKKIPLQIIFLRTCVYL
jgi:hypothetical protein